jgi:exodeoxyribonuclease-3
MKIISYNVNGLRAAIRKGFNQWLLQEDPDVICLQELKATPDQIDELFYLNEGYQAFWMPAQKKGYSGVAVFSKIEPQNVVYGCGIKKYDDEGRMIRLDYGDFSVMSVYFPSGSSGEHRQEVKMAWLDDFMIYLEKLKKLVPNLIMSGDFNICHKPIDIHNPVSNKKSSGFLPEEREWFTKFLDSGFVDTFRHFNTDPHNYSWWSFRNNVRAANKGWRIDYQIASNNMISRLKSATILPDAKHSDHCPVVVELN